MAKKGITLAILLLVTILVTGCNPLDRKTKSGLQVLTEDIPSSLFLDGQYLEKTPYIGKDIKPGQYTLRIQPDDPTLLPYETTITLRKGLVTAITWRPGSRPELSGGVIYEIERLSNRKASEVLILTIPDGAIISITGREKDYGPLNITEIEPGEKEFEVMLPSYKPQKHTIKLLAGHRTTITIKLAKAEAVMTAAELALQNTRNISTDSADLQPVATASGQGAGRSLSTRQATASAQAAATALASTSAQATTSTNSGSSISGPQVLIKPTGYRQNGQEVLRVRDRASVSGTEIGVVVVGNKYSYTGQTLDGWLQIVIEGQNGWVSSQFAELRDNSL